MAQRVRIGIIGYGKMGSQHAKALMNEKVSNATLTCVADIDPSRLEVAQSTYEDKLSYFDSAEALIKSGVCDAIIPTVPHYFHPPFAIMAFEVGLHVLCEKPAGVYMSQANQMIDAAQKSGKVFSMMLNQRTNPLYQKARQLVQEGELGRIIHANWIITSWFRSQSYYDKSSWRATWSGEGGGVLVNQNPHNLDLWQWILGMPTRVKATVYYGKHRNIETEDDVYALFEFPNGATGMYTTTIADSPGTNRFEISGTKGKLVIEDNTLKLFRLNVSIDEFNATFDGEIGQPTCQMEEIALEGKYTSHVGIMENFASAILAGDTLIAPGEDGLASLAISNAIHLSSWSGDSWIDIPCDEELFNNHLAKRCGGQLPV